MEKTVILLDDDRNLIFNGKILPEELNGLNLKEEIQEVVDGIIVHTYTVQNIEPNKQGTIKHMDY